MHRLDMPARMRDKNRRSALLEETPAVVKAITHMHTSPPTAPSFSPKAEARCSEGHLLYHGSHTYMRIPIPEMNQPMMMWP